jgi:AmiR/NasT family two-component response regulator
MAAQSSFSGLLHGRRVIGIATGMLMDRFTITDVEAFDMLLEASISSCRTLADVSRCYIEGREPTSGARSSN